MNTKQDLPYTNILGVKVSDTDLKRALQQIQAWIDTQDRQYVCVANVHTLTESQRDARLRRINNAAGMVTPDGMPLVWLSRWQGHPQVSRVYGPDLLLAACAASQQAGWSHYFYGGAPGVAGLLATRLKERFPQLKIAGAVTPPFRPLTPEEDHADIAQINAAAPDILWVGLGAPKQEYWMAAHREQISAPVMIGIGAAFDFHAGLKPQAPLWMQRSGFEWFFRLLHEPRRLWKRYLINNPLFLALCFLQWTGLKRFPIEEDA
jgi:N-acetylglucosaminyldiphosphoundecaprenol N-acetyl-beta-D-mannosaminyltransferase